MCNERKVWSTWEAKVSGKSSEMFLRLRGSQPCKCLSHMLFPLPETGIWWEGVGMFEKKERHQDGWSAVSEPLEAQKPGFTSFSLCIVATAPISSHVQEYLLWVDGNQNLWKWEKWQQ